MLVTLKNGRNKKFPDAVARVLVKRGLAKEVVEESAPVVAPAAQTYQTRDMQAAAPAPYGYKADGTPRLRPAPQPRNTEG